MSRRKPDVQWHNPSLDPEASQEKQKRGIATALRHSARSGPKAFKTKIARSLKEQQETQHDRPGANMRHNEVKNPGFTGFVLLMFETHQAISRERHDFPDD